MDLFLLVRLMVYFNCSKIMDFPNKLVASSSYMTLWVSKSQVPKEVWISVYMIPPIIFNLFNVRRYGEIEFWHTLQKIFTFVLLIIYGLLAAMGASSKPLLSGTSANYNVIPCDNPSKDNCVGPLGFNCISPLDSLTKTGEKPGSKTFC